MLVNASFLENARVLSLHTGTQIAQVTHCLIDPDTLIIIAFHLEATAAAGEGGDFLPVRSIREYSKMGIIVDSADDFASDGEVIKIDQIVALNFDLIDLNVRTKKGSKIGKIFDYTVNTTDWEVRQLIVRRPFWKSLLDPELVIARDSIIEVDDYKVIIEDEHAKGESASEAKTEIIPEFVNPFRDPDFAGNIESDAS